MPELMTMGEHLHSSVQECTPTIFQSVLKKDPEIYQTYISCLTVLFLRRENWERMSQKEIMALFRPEMCQGLE